ncbi:hypothetical protein ANO11243_043230 [Dothideomycetidae sp. 11243]|nr:hypothetical protein ANO11243_043230 [fungal sp. No.11243]
MAAPKETKQYILAEKPTGSIKLDSAFKLVTNSLPELKDNQVLIQTKFLSNDPAQRGWINPTRSADRLYVPPVEVGDVMRARGICTVVKSNSSSFKEGQSVVATCGWTEYAVVNAKECTPLQTVGDLKETHFLGALGATGLTAMYGLDVVDTSAKDQVLVVSGAAGATGSMVVQIAKKLIGVKTVIGMAGTDEKCAWVKSLGADICLNYKSKDFKKQLRDATPGPHYVDVYFDNVGGTILDLMLTRMGKHGRVACCGAVSNYDAGDKAEPIRAWGEVISQRIQLKGFIIFDAAPKFGEYTQRLIKGYKDGKLSISDENETIKKVSFEQIPQTWLTLFEGANTGKLVTAL